MVHLKKCLDFVRTHQFLFLKLFILVLTFVGEDGPPRE